MEFYHSGTVLVRNTLILMKFILLVAGLAGASPAFAVDGIPVPFKASYSLSIMGTKFALMKRSFTRLSGGEYSYLSETNTTGLAALLYKDRIVEQSTWLLDNGKIKPIQYSYDRSGGKKIRKVTIAFNWNSGMISTSVNGDAWHMPVRDNIMDKLLYQIAIMHDLELGRKNIDYTIADGGKIKTYHFDLLGEERLDTPLGEFKTLKLIRHKPNSKDKTTLWCADTLNYLPVRVENIEKNGRKTTAVIESLTGMGF